MKKQILFLSLSLFGALPALAAKGNLAMEPVDFYTDGCSRFPDGDLRKPDRWLHCCVKHDIAYFRGGVADLRKTADKELKTCVRKASGSAALAETMYLGVRAGGGPEHHTDYRWAYGWEFGQGYKALSKTQLSEAQKKIKAFDCVHDIRKLTQNPDTIDLICSYFVNEP